MLEWNKKKQLKNTLDMKKEGRIFPNNQDTREREWTFIRIQHDMEAF